MAYSIQDHVERARNLTLRSILKLFPPSPRFVRTCREYVNRADAENNDDWRTNGERFFLQEYLPQCRIVFDVGANTGQWASVALEIKNDIELHSFEPETASFRALSAHNFPSSVTLNNCGLSSSPGQAELHIFNDCNQLNSLYRRTGLGSYGLEPQELSEPVQLTTIDAYCTKHRINQIDLLKIDVEGHDLEVLRGAHDLLESRAIRFIQFEYGRAFIDSRVFLKDFFELLQPLGYSIFKLAPNELRLLPEYDQAFDNFQYANYVALLEVKSA